MCQKCTTTSMLLLSNSNSVVERATKLNNSKEARKKETKTQKISNGIQFPFI